MAFRSYKKSFKILKNNSQCHVPFLDPESVDIHIDGETDKCSRSEDINFHFKGFSVFGQVVSSGSAEGPEDLLVELINKKEDKIISSTKTGKSGK